MKSVLFFTGIAAMILASSCDKPHILHNESASVEAEIQRTEEELRNIDAKFEALRTAPVTYGMTLDRQLDEAVKKNAKLEDELAHLSKKCAEAEAAVGELHLRWDSYKTSYPR